MSAEINTKSKSQIAIKIIIPILLVCGVFGIWFIKNHKNSTDTATADKQGSVAPDSTTTNKQSLVASDNSNLKSTDSPDFDLEVTEKIVLEKLKSYGVPIVIDFGSDSCIPCKKMAPVLKELNSELKGKAIVKFVDVWKYPDLADGYPISLIPTQILIDANGKPYNPKDPQALQMKQYSSKDTGEHVFTTHEGGITKEKLLGVLKEMGLK